MVCGSDGGMRKCMWAPDQNLTKVRWETERWMEVLLSGAGCPGLRAGCPGCRVGCLGSGSEDELEELRVEEAKSGQDSRDFVDGNWGKDGGKVDLPATHKIRGSNPTKLHHTNKSQ